MTFGELLSWCNYMSSICILLLVDVNGSLHKNRRGY